MSSGFISESELAEKRRIRQEEWEKVRQPGQPSEVPEEPFDHRSLYERLEEQRQKKQLEYEEAHKLKNMIKGLDDDEVEFLDLVDQKKLEAEQLKELEERKELLDFRKKVEQLRESTLDQRIQAEIQPSKSNSLNSSGIKSQHKLLKGAVVRKRVSDQSVNKSNENDVNNKNNKSDKVENNGCSGKKRRRSEDAEDYNKEGETSQSGLTCVGILPGLGYYESSDDSERSSSGSEIFDDKKYDLAGRRIVYMSKNEKE